MFIKTSPAKIVPPFDAILLKCLLINILHFNNILINIYGLAIRDQLAQNA
jgi:hypothetical protein